MLHIHLFQNLMLSADGAPIHFSPLPKTYSLLAYLLLYRQRPVSREKLATLLWDEVLDKEARANLRRHLHNLNKTLPSAKPHWLLIDNKQVQWNPAAHYWLDIAAFEAAAQSSANLAEAAALYQGDLLPDLYDDWLTPERARFKQIYLQVLTKLAKHHQEQAQFQQAVAVLQKLLQADPLDETAVRTAMQLRFYHLHDRTGALQLYKQFQTHLASELDVLPMAETTALYEIIAATQTHSVAQGPALPPHNLPAPLNSFVGRQQELEMLYLQLGTTETAVRLLTITGPAGSGKTRLALAAGHQLLRQAGNRFSDGIYFVDLAPLTEPEQLIGAIAETIGLDERDGRSLATKVTESLKHQRCLFILDNFEHLLPAAPHIHKLLAAAPDLQLLVTSQTPLNLYGEHQLPLTPLPLPTAEDVTDHKTLSTNPAIALFVDRVKATQPTFTLNQQNAPTIAAICRQLDGIPLALELAAGRSKYFSLTGLLEQLADRLSFLTSKRMEPARKQTLRAAIDWSYQLLTQAEQQLFNQLSPFAGSISLEAATAVSALENPKEVEAQLFSLVERNITYFVPAEGNESPRLAILGVLRDYGLEKLHKDQAEATRVQHRYQLYYVEQAEVAEQQFYSSNQAEWLRWLQWESANLTAVYQNLLQEARAGDPHLLLRFTMAMDKMWEYQGQFTAAYQRLEQAVAYYDLLPIPEQIRLFNKAGGAAQWTGNHEAAFTHHQSALQLAQRIESDTAVAHTLHFLGTAVGRQGDYAKAQQLLEQSLSTNKHVMRGSPR